MGATNDYDIVNLALMKIGQKKISSLTDTGDPTAVKANVVYGPLRKKLLMEHPWPFALKRAILGHVVDSEKTITAATQASPVVITAAAHGFSNGNIVAIYSVAGMIELNGRTYTVANKTTDTFELSGVDGTGYTAYSSGGKVGKVTVVGQEYPYDYRYQMPSDYLRPIELNGEDVSELNYSLEATSGSLELLTDEGTAYIKYIASITDTTKFDDIFVHLFSLLIASELAYTISQSKTMADGLAKLYETEFARAKGLAAQSGGSPREPLENEVFDARE